MEKIIKMPHQIAHDFLACDFLVRLQNDIIDSPEDKIILDFQDCKFSHAIFTAFIGSLSVWASYFGKNIIYRLDKTTNLYSYFKSSGLYEYLTCDETKYANKNSIPFCEVNMDDEAIIDYINNILELAPVQLSPKAEELLFKNIYEIFHNSVDHSGAVHGVYACGHWMPKKKQLVFSVYDTGIGIPSLVKNKIDKNFSSQEAIEWALVHGNSTKQLTDGIPRGLGLSDLKDFISLNGGKFNIVSYDVYYSLHGNETTIKTLSKPIIGTMISFIIKNDDDHIYIANQEA